jgi:hypothetical protein
MSTIEARLDDILAHPLREALSSNGGALGYVGLDIPADLLAVPGKVTCHLPWRRQVSPSVADQWLESSFPGWARSIVKDWAAGQFDCFEHVVFSRGEDAAHRLYYYICELQRRGQLSGPRPLVFDIAKIPRESSRQHTVAALHKLMRQLGLAEHELVAGVARANEVRDLMSRLQRNRSGPGRLYEKLVRASLFADIRAIAESWPDEVPQGSERTVILVGSTPPDATLHAAVEGAGWNVVEEFYDRCMDRCGGIVSAATPADPVAAVVTQWLEHQNGRRAFKDPAEPLAARLRRRKIGAAVLWCAREDETLAWRVPAQHAVLAAAGIPTLVMTARSWNLDDGAKAEIDGFLRRLG